MAATTIWSYSPRCLPGSAQTSTLRAVFRQEGGGILGQVRAVDAPQHQAALGDPLPGVAQVAKLDALVAGGCGVVVVGWVVPADAEGVVAGDEPFHVAAQRLFGAEAFDAAGGALAVEFVRIGRDLPGCRGGIQECALPGEGIEQAMCGCRRGD